MAQENRIDDLLLKLLHNQCSDAEKQELFRLTGEVHDEEELSALLERAWNGYDQPSHVLEEGPSRAILMTIFGEHNKEQRTSLRSVYKRWYWAAAAVLVVIVAVKATFFTGKNKLENGMATVAVNGADINAPTVSKASITLANGKVIYLDKAAKGTLTEEEGVNVSRKSAESVVYAADKDMKSLVYNTLSNPRGSKVVNLVLSDGTKVWLNSASSLRFPINFVGQDRLVEVTGEAYFEVAGNAVQPFKVSANDIVVNVLGTHFNINAYPEEAAIVTTLLEGKVKLTGKDKSVLLNAGQQAQFYPALPKPFIMASDVDIDQTMAWKNGTFQFDNAELPVIMRQLARWYDVNIVYEKPPNNEKYGGNIRMDASLQDALKMLEANGINCHVSGKNVIVKP